MADEKPGEAHYNPQGLRTLKYDGTTTLYHYDPQGHLLQETDPTGSLIRAYVWADDMPIAQITKTQTGEVLAYLHTDHQTTPRLAINTQGKVIWRYEGNAFGDTPPMKTRMGTIARRRLI